MSEIAYLAAGEALSKLIDWGTVKITERRKQKAIEKLLNETATRAAMTPSSVDLATKFKDKSLIEEMLAHHRLQDKNRAETIAIFLDGKADDRAASFVGEFYDKITAILATGKETLTGRKTLKIAEETQSDVKALRAEMEKTATDENAQFVLLEEIVKRIEFGKIEVKHIVELAESAAGSFASSYLLAYYTLCTDKPADFAAIQKTKGHDRLALALASIALSIGRADDTIATLQLCSFDTSSAISVVRKLLEEPTQIDGQMGIAIPETEETIAFINLINFEYIYRRHAFLAAADFANDNTIAWNPIALEKRALSDLAAAFMVSNPNMLLLTNRTLDRHRPWFPESLTSQYKNIISIALNRLDKEQTEAVIEAMPEELSQFAQDEEKRLTLRECTDISVATKIATWAEARQNHVLLIDAAIKMIDLDKGQRTEIVKIFERCKTWAFQTAGALSLYANLLNPDITYTDYCDYGRGKENEAPFHLVAYKKFRDTNPEEAKNHIERAIEIMKSDSGSPDLLNSRIWVPYLIENSREKELKELVTNLLPLAPYDYIMEFLSAIANSPGSGVLLDYFIESIVGSDFRDPHTAELTAQHLSTSGQPELAGRVALAAFKKAPSEILAGLATQWMIESSLDIDDEIIRYATEADTAQMNLLVASIANENGMPQKRNAHLLRAAFGNDETNARALMLYAIWNVGNKEERTIPDEIGPDTYATFISSNGDERTSIFLSNQEAVKSEGASGPAGTVFSTQSSQFLNCRGLRVGDTTTIDSETLTVSEVGLAEYPLMQAGFKELPKSQGGMIITGTPEEILDKMVDLLKNSSTGIDTYQNGLITENGTLYYGIETGGIINSARQLEFTIDAICNPYRPYRKHPISRNLAHTPETKFLLSYNALVVLALLKPPDEVVEAIQDKCAVTESTAKRLRKCAQALADEPYSGSGRLGYDGKRPIFYEYNEESKRFAKEKSLLIIGLVDRLKKVKPFLTNPNVQMSKVLADNEIIDIQTAAANDLAFVTEDILEAQLVDQFSLANRCSISLMLLCLGCTKYMLQEYTDHMVEWGAEPVLELDLVESLRSIGCPLASFGINIV